MSRVLIIYVRDDGEVADVAQVTQGSALKKTQTNCPLKNSREVYLIATQLAITSRREAKKQQRRPTGRLCLLLGSFIQPI